MLFFPFRMPFLLRFASPSPALPGPALWEGTAVTSGNTASLYFGKGTERATICSVLHSRSWARIELPNSLTDSFHHTVNLLTISLSIPMCKTQDADQGPQRVQGSTIVSSSIYFILDSVLGTRDTVASRPRHSPTLRELTRQSTGAENPPQDHQEVDSMISQENGPKKRLQAVESLKQRHLTPPGA